MKLFNFLKKTVHDKPHRRGILKIHAIGDGHLNMGQKYYGEFIVEDTGEEFMGKIKIRIIDDFSGNMNKYQVKQFFGLWYYDHQIEWEK